jgi:hypothetical protein
MTYGGAGRKKRASLLHADTLESLCTVHGAYITVVGLIYPSIVVVGNGCILFGPVRTSDRPEAYAQTATPRVSTWTAWAREKKPGKVVEGFLGPKPRLGGLSLSRARNTSSEERRERKREESRETQRRPKDRVWRLSRLHSDRTLRNVP